MELDSADSLYKVVLTGEGGVGKTYLIQRFVKGPDAASNTATLGVEYLTKVARLEDGRKVRAQIWDTIGCERYRALTASYYRRADGAILVYDVTNRATFEKCQSWMEEMRQHVDPSCCVVLVGNKTDLVQSEAAPRAVAKEEAQEYAESMLMDFFETSALDAESVDAVFMHLLNLIAESKQDFGQRLETSTDASGEQGQQTIRLSADQTAGGQKGKGRMSAKDRAQIGYNCC